MWLSFLAFCFHACFANLQLYGSAWILTHAVHHLASDYVHVFHQRASQTCTNAFAIGGGFDRGEGSSLEKGHFVYKCHYFSGTSAYCYRWAWVLRTAQRGEVGGMYQPVWWTTKWIEWRMWWRERERVSKKWRSEWREYSVRNLHIHRKEAKLKFLVGREINKQGFEKWSSFPENSISSFYSSDNRSFLENDEIAFWATLKQS